MHLSDLIGVIADETGIARGRLEMLARRLKDGGLIAKSTGGRNSPPVHIEDAVKLILAHLSGAEYATVADRVRRMLTYTDTEGAGVMLFVTRMLRVAFTAEPYKFDKDDMRSLWVASSLTVVDSPDRPAVVIRMGCTDGAEELAFTPDGKEYRPQFSEHIATAQTLPGFLFLRISLGIRALMTGVGSDGIERRTVPATFEVA